MIKILGHNIKGTSYFLNLSPERVSSWCSLLYFSFNIGLHVLYPYVITTLKKSPTSINIHDTMDYFARSIYVIN